MSEYIEREAVLQHKRKMSGADFGGEFWDEAVLCEDIKNIPTADVVEVVRCKDCTMWERNRISCEGRARCLTGEGGTRYRGRNDFCSIGIKMDGKGDGE